MRKVTTFLLVSIDERCVAYQNERAAKDGKKYWPGSKIYKITSIWPETLPSDPVVEEVKN